MAITFGFIVITASIPSSPHEANRRFVRIYKVANRRFANIYSENLLLGTINNYRHPRESGVIARNPKANPVRHCEEGQGPDAAI